MAYLTGYERKQAQLFPSCIDELIALDSEVRIIDMYVDTMDMDQLGFKKDDADDNGRPGYDPKDLFKLYMYGYMNRIRTSRLLERECTRNIELMWLLKGLNPCFRTIAGFRSQNPQAFRKIFSSLVGQLSGLKLIGGKTIAIDSSKFRAVNSKKNNYNVRKVKRHLELIDEKMNSYIQLLDKEDLSNEKEQEIQQKIKKKKEQRIKYESIQKQIDASGGDQVSTTDPDSRSMILHGSVIEVAYNVQTAVDEKHKLITSFEATNLNDRKALLVKSLHAMKACGVEEITVLADKGYHNGEQLAACEKENITTFVAYPQVPRGSDIPTPQYYGDKFIYDKSEDTYTCPKGHVMHTNGNTYDKMYVQFTTKVKHYKTSECSNCPVKNLCTRNVKGRLIERSEHAHAVEANASRVDNHYEIYQKRQQIVEHIFGTIKRQWGYDHILLKGLTKNNGEFSLIYFIYNFRRLINILGTKRLKKWIKSLLFLLLNIQQSVHRTIQNFLSAISINYQYT
jgi:transposase/IS5 family transposase